MEVLVKIDDKLVQSARHRALDCGLSLSGWLASLVAREVSGSSAGGVSPPRRVCLLDAIGDEALADMDFAPAVVNDKPEAADFGT